MADEIEVTVSPDGTWTIRGEDTRTTGIKNELAALGEVVERHVGHAHVKESTEQRQRT